MSVTRGTFAPNVGSIGVSFVHGNEGLAPIPFAVAESGLNERFADVQHTYVEGCVDAYFDEQLWRTLVGFIVTHGQAATVISARSVRDMNEESLSWFMGEWEQIDSEDRDPPCAILVRRD
jgi:hypothetical protein